MSKRICLAIPSLSLGGMERVMIEIAGYIKDNTDNEVFIIKLARTEKNFYTAPQGVTVIEPDFFFNRKLRLYHSLKLLFFLIKTLRRIKPNSVLSFGEMYNSFVLLSSFFTNAKYFVSDRSQPNKRWGFFHENFRRIIYKRAYGIIAQTTYSQKFFEKELGHNNIKVIPNPAREYHYSNEKKENVVLYVGRLIKSKRVDLLLDIFSNVDNQEWKLWIVGDGPEMAKLENQVSTLKCKDRITLFGAQKDILKFYSKAKIFAFTSVSEGFPNVLIEAQSSALPCISFDCVAGPSDIIDDHENGFLIPLLDTEIFQAKLSIMMNDQNLLDQMSANALKSSEKYKVEVVAAQFFKFITS